MVKKKKKKKTKKFLIFFDWIVLIKKKKRLLREQIFAGNVLPNAQPAAWLTSRRAACVVQMITIWTMKG